ncbi:hypothetical protein ASZ90_001483 [hydrocarbon metagenome]|uniref:Uncharacterized protein n=1 Tax=hydrocarbon metagenome TaxID=938273 RepID=A0A0W8G675_9ZZZZ
MNKIVKKCKTEEKNSISNPPKSRDKYCNHVFFLIFWG